MFKRRVISPSVSGGSSTLWLPEIDGVFWADVGEPWADVGVLWADVGGVWVDVDGWLTAASRA